MKYFIDLIIIIIVVISHSQSQEVTGKLTAKKYAWNQLICISFLLFECNSVTSPLKTASNLMVGLGTSQFGSAAGALPHPCLVSKLVTHRKYIHTCLAEISSFLFSQQKNFLCRTFEMSNHRKFSLRFTTKLLVSCRHNQSSEWVPEYHNFVGLLTSPN